MDFGYRKGRNISVRAKKKFLIEVVLFLSGLHSEISLCWRCVLEGICYYFVGLNSVNNHCC